MLTLTIKDKLVTETPSARGRASTYAGGRQANNGGPVYLYAAYCKGFGKVGLSEDPRKRQMAMQSSCPFPVEMLAAFPMSKDDAKAAELEAIEALSGLHWFGDWFKCTRAEVRFVVQKQAEKRTLVAPIMGFGQSRAIVPRGVIGPDGTVYATCALAAKAQGISRQAMYLRVNRGSSGWRWKDTTP